MRKLIILKDGHTKWNEDKILHLKLYMRNWLETLSDMLGWHKIWIGDIIPLTTWPCTIYRPDGKWGLDSVSQVLPVALTSDCVRYVRVMVVAWLVYNFQTGTRIRTRFCISCYTQLLTSNFAGCVGFTYKLRHWRHHGGQVTWLQVKDQKQKWDQDLLGLL